MYLIVDMLAIVKQNIISLFLSKNFDQNYL